MLFFSSQQTAILKTLTDYQVEFMIVGGYAVKFYLPERITHDLDLLIHISAENKQRFTLAFANYPVDLKKEIDDLQNGKSFAIANKEIEFLPDYKNYSYLQLKTTAQSFDHQNQLIKVIGLHDLIAIKRQYTDAKHLEDVVLLTLKINALNIS